MEEKLYYITDTYGSFYGMNQLNKLVAVSDIQNATKFTLIKATNVIQNMIKPMQRYQFVLREATTEEGKEPEYVEVSEDECYHTRFDNMDTDWNGYMEDLISFCSQLSQYQTNLNFMLSEVDKEICDIMHYIEFYNLDAAKGYKMYKMLKDCRLRRRKIKDEREKVSAAIQAVGNLEFVEKIKTCLCQMKGLDKRKYTPRILDELFEEAS